MQLSNVVFVNLTRGTIMSATISGISDVVLSGTGRSGKLGTSDVLFSKIGISGKPSLEIDAVKDAWELSSLVMI